MTLFLITFFLIYGGMNFYAFRKLKSALSFNIKAEIAMILVLAILVTAPLLTRILEKAELAGPAKTVAFIGYLWLGFILLFCSYAAVLDLYRLLMVIVGMISRKNLSHIAVTPFLAFFLPLLLSLLTLFYGIFEAQAIRTEKITIKTQKLPSGIKRFKIGVISDLHLGLIVREKHLRRTLDIIRHEQPDMVVSVGDLVDGQICELNGLSDLFRGINPQFGKFAVTGNHEFYAGFDQAKCFIENSGFVLLRGEGITAGGVIAVAGVDDPVGQTLGLSEYIHEQGLLSGLPHDKFTLLLKHRPFVDTSSEGHFDLQLSGHVHKGQIFPFSILTKLHYPVHAGLASVAGGSSLYVSRGTGTWGPPIRFLSPPEVTIIELVPQN